MTDEHPLDDPQSASEPTEEQLRAAMEEEMRRVHVGDLVLQSVVSLVNLGARRTGSTPETAAELDLEQVKIAIDAVTGLLPAVDAVAPEQTPAVKEALSQLQLAYVKAGGRAAGDDQDGSGEGPDGPGPAERSGRIWVPGS